MQHRYKHKLFLYYFSVFALLTSAFIAFQYHREKQFRIDQLETTLENITEMTNLFILQKQLVKQGNFHVLDSLSEIIPQPDARITVISRKGAVLYDNFVTDFKAMENHLQRPEVQKAFYAEFGSNIRHSATTGEDFYYYARFFDGYFVRVAVVYDVKIRNFLKAERLFLFFVVFGFVMAWLVLSYVTKKMSEHITRLKDLASGLIQEKPQNEVIPFPDNELGVIGEYLLALYNRLVDTRKERTLERDKLERLLFVLKEGIGFFSPRKALLVSNSRFTEYVNRIAAKSSINSGHFFKVEAFQDIHNFLYQHTKPGSEVIQPGHFPMHEISLEVDGRNFRVQCVIFSDRGFVIVIEEKMEKT
ncbi:MAG: hypothetical protein JEZ14_06735 [Marinilabiliaceae bacterium]|nr:hypothetical protein [Marinilabiliaceae bacterium]